MMNQEATPIKQKLSLVYLWLVLPATAAIGFGIGRVSHTIYLLFWGLNACLMILSAYHIGARRLWKQDGAGFGSKMAPANSRLLPRYYYLYQGCYTANVS